MPDGNLFADKRIHPRVSVKIPVKYRIAEELKGISSLEEWKKKEKTTQSVDISLGGMYIVAEKKLEAGMVLHIDISLPGQPAPFSTMAQVTWSNEKGAGLHFLTLKKANLEILKAYLNKVSAENH
jgi:c-di-GMP-binding flagellar brake protein YcgR